ncbi:MAG: hypothetical protein RL757_1451, partial [Bacteroidota bacterium]
DFCRLNDRDRDREIRRYAYQNCLRAEQIKLLSMLYTNDRDKSEFFAYVYRERRIYDINLFYQCASVFGTRAAQDAFYRFLHRENLPCGHEVYDDYDYWEHNGSGNHDDTHYDNRGGGNGGGRGGNGGGNGGGRGSGYDDRGGNGGGRDDRDNRGGGGRNNPVQPPPPPPPPPYLTDGEFQPMLASLRAENFDNKRVEKAKFMIRGNALLTCAQICQMSRTFSFDNSRLDFAKFAYDFCFDKQNYFQVADTMQFENNKSSLMKYVGGR